VKWKRVAVDIPRGTLWRSTSTPVYQLLELPTRCLAFTGISKEGRTATCLGGFNSLADAKRYCEGKAGEIQPPPS
jgi:hypothetical protein